MKQFTMPIIFWLLTIEDEKIRKAAIRNAEFFSWDVDYIADEVASLSEAIFEAFTWELTPEKHNYWFDLYHQWKKL